MIAPTGTSTVLVATEIETLRTYITVEKTITKPTTIIPLSEKTIPDTLTFVTTETFYEINRGIDASCITFKTNKDVYKISEKVILVLENNCDFTLLLPNSAPWKVFDSNLNEVFAPIALQVITEVKPGSSRTWLWNQKSYNGAEVLPGIYYIVLETVNMGTVGIQVEIV
ncbi:MAG: hypothetical protein QXK24_08665 [Ignisphaera sp.]